MSSPLLLLSLLSWNTILASASTSASAPLTCYWRSSNVINVETSPTWFACNNTQEVPGGAQLCCLGSSQCGENSICRQASSGGGSGWFVGGCTDPTYQDPVCRNSCTGDAQTWIQYNYKQQLWHCCGSDGCTGTPTNETFQATPPDLFTPIPSGPQSSSSSTTATSSATHLSTANPAASTGLSTGAQVGIGVAAAIAGLAIIAAIAFFVLWRRASSRHKEDQKQSQETRWQQEQMSQQQQQVAAHYANQPGYYQPVGELPHDGRSMQELAGDGAEAGK